MVYLVMCSASDDLPLLRQSKNYSMPKLPTSNSGFWKKLAAFCSLPCFFRHNHLWNFLMYTIQVIIFASFPSTRQGYLFSLYNSMTTIPWLMGHSLRYHQRQGGRVPVKYQKANSRHAPLRPFLPLPSLAFTPGLITSRMHFFRPDSLFSPSWLIEALMSACRVPACCLWHPPPGFRIYAKIANRS